MGQPVRIYELAERMIRLAGFEPGDDIAIEITGLRPGERLHEILFAEEEPMAEIGIAGIIAAKPIFAGRERVEAWLGRLRDRDRGERPAAPPRRCSRRRSRASAVGARAPRQRCKPSPRPGRRHPSQPPQRRRARHERASQPRKGL